MDGPVISVQWTAGQPGGCGWSILIPVFAMMVAEPGDWQAWWVFGAPAILALGFLLQAVVVARPRHRTTVANLGALLPRFMRLSFDR